MQVTRQQIQNPHPEAPKSQLEFRFCDWNFGLEIVNCVFAWELGFGIWDLGFANYLPARPPPPFEFTGPLGVAGLRG
jgi:hypothetical protein